jgi:hypothetical protein
MRGLDPRIQRSLGDNKALDRRVKPGDDEKGAGW